jgi:hypothetical protein
VYLVDGNVVRARQARFMVLAARCAMGECRPTEGSTAANKTLSFEAALLIVVVVLLVGREDPR